VVGEFLKIFKKNPQLIFIVRSAFSFICRSQTIQLVNMLMNSYKASLRL